jgi:uncharacterized membrane protein
VFATLGCLLAQPTAGGDMRHFSFRPSFTVRGRTFKGIRGWSGKPLHPPLTDIPVGAYMLAAAFDVISFAAGEEQPWARDFYRAASFVLIGGAIVSVLAACTGFWDWLRSTEPGTQARRTANAHAVTMVTVTLLIAVGIAVRATSFWDEPATPLVALCLSIGAAALTAVGAALGGTMVFDYGFNVETAGDSPVWHRSESDELPRRGSDVVDVTAQPSGVEPPQREPSHR